MKEGLWGMLCLFVLLVLSVHCSQPTSFASTSKFTPLLLSNIEHKRFLQPELKAWVFFHQKTKSHPVVLHELSVQRRRNVVGYLQEDLVDEMDWELNQEHIEAIRQTGAKVTVQSKWLNAVSVLATPSQLSLISQHPFVLQLDLVRTAKRNPIPSEPPSTKRHISNISQDPAGLHYGESGGALSKLRIPDAHALGYTGKGVRILVLDSGFYKHHEAFQSTHFLAEYDFVNDNPNTFDETTDSDTPGQMSHGTSVLSLIVGKAEGKLYGGAFEAGVLLAKTEDLRGEKPIEEDYFVAGLEWGESQGAHMASSSLGYHDWWNFYDYDGNHSVASRAIDIASNRGMVVLMAIGNYHLSSLTTPADAHHAISVGSVSPSGHPSPFSSVGPTADGRIKPEISAVGESIYVASYSSPTSYTRSSGTSFATPLVAGGVALILQANPKWTPAQVKESLIKTASLAPQFIARNMVPDTSEVGLKIGFGVPDILAAISYQHGSCESSCKNGECVSGKCVCKPGYYSLNCDVPYIKCQDWCNGVCFNERCLCTSTRNSRCLDESIPDWTCDKEEYNDGEICNFCGETSDPDCMGFTKEDCSTTETSIPKQELPKYCSKPSQEPPTPPLPFQQIPQAPNSTDGLLLYLIGCVLMVAFFVFRIVKARKLLC